MRDGRSESQLAAFVLCSHKPAESKICPRRRRTDTLSHLAVAYMREKDKPRAVDLLMQLRSEFPDNP